MPARTPRGQATRSKLIATARDHLGRDGYEVTSIEAILRETGVSRGALYHHFAGKEDLFLAVLHDIEADIAATVIEAARAHRDPFARLRAGCIAWLRLAQDPAVQRIALIDAPSVVGWATLRRVDEQHVLGALTQGVALAATDGRLASELVEPIAHMLLAALNEAALYVARGEEPETRFRTAQTALEQLLTRLFGDPTADAA